MNYEDLHIISLCMIGSNETTKRIINRNVYLLFIIELWELHVNLNNECQLMNSARILQ